MPGLLKIFLFVAAVLTSGALVAPPVFWAGQAMAAAGISDWLAGFPFHRVLTRSVQISALVLLWPAIRWLGVRRWSELNLLRNPVAVRDVVAGLVLSAGVVFLLALFYVAAGFFVPRAEWAWLGLGRIVMTAAAVSAIEEFLFRGVILGICLWSLRPWSALTLTTVLFTAVHFVRPARTELSAEAVRWWSGFSELGSFVSNLPAPALLLFGAASLFAAGWILGDAALRTKSLCLPFGLHAGWIFSQQTSNLVLQPAGGDALQFLPLIGPSLVSGAVPTGLLPLVAIVVTAVLVRFYLRHVFRPVSRSAA